MKKRGKACRGHNMKFMGYHRKDGQIGVRNHVIVMSTVSCINPVTEQIAKATNTVPITHGSGCGQTEEDYNKTQWSLARYAENPNVAAAFIVGLGCEQIEAENLAEEIRGKPTGFVKTSEEGENAALAKGIKKVREMKVSASRLKREETPLSKLILNVQCGGSDTTSGLASNPAVGAAADLLIEEGGTVLLEVAAFGEHRLLKNVTDRKVIEALWTATDKEAEKDSKLTTVRGINPTPGNIRQGLTTLTEKRLGGIMKGGNTPLKGVISYKEKPQAPGLYHVTVKDYIGYTDVTEATMRLLSGSQINCFTTGCGQPMGLAIAPVIKINGNPINFEKNRENMDLNASGILYGEETIEDVGKRIFNEIIEVANGNLTRSEIMGHRDFILGTFASNVNT
jgi:altronate dehydratase large subunit